MPWLFLLLALGALAVAFKTTSMALMLLCLVVSLGLIIAWIMALLAQRLGARSRDADVVLDPAELRRLQEQAEARRAAAVANEPPVR